MRLVILPIFILILFGCNSKKVKTAQQVAETKAVSSSDIQKDIQSAPLNPDDTIPNVSIPADAIRVTDDKVDSTSNIHMLWNGDGIERTPALSKLHWKALTYKKGSYYLQDTKIKLKSARYPEGTEEEGEIGLFMSAIDKDAQYLLSGLNIVNGPVDTVLIKKKIFYPGQKEIFSYKGITYTLYATGHKMDSVKKGYNNYKLFLTANVKGHTFNQLIASAETYFGDTDDAEVLSFFQINFIGDIDGDNIPDIIIMELGNFWSTTNLYVSSIAGDTAIVKKVAFF